MERVKTAEVTARQILQVGKLMDEGMTADDVSSKMKVPIGRVRYLRRVYCSIGTPPKHEERNKWIDQLRGMAKNGMTMQQAADELDCTYARVAYAAKSNGIAFVGGWRTTRDYWVPLFEEAFRQKLTAKQFGDLHKIKAGAVYTMLKRYDLKNEFKRTRCQRR